MYCSNCGKELPDSASFCPGCGAPCKKEDTGNRYREREDTANPRENHSYREQRDQWSSQNNRYSKREEMSGGSIMKAGIIILAVAVVIVGIGAFAYVSHKSRQDELRMLQAEKDEALAKAEEAKQQAELAAQQAEEAQKTQETQQETQENTQKGAVEAPKTETVNNYYYYQGSHYGQYDYYDNVQADGYLWPTDEYYISYDDLDWMNRDTVEAVRNEIYARHGYAFQKKKWQNYFGAKSWYYRDNSCTQEVAKKRMNSIEKSNLETIVSYEEMMGWR